MVNSPADITVLDGAPSVSLSNSTVTASPSVITADSSSTSTITVQLKDASGNNITSSAGTVTLTKTGGGGVLSAVTDNGNGTYTATLTSGKTVATVTITAKLSGQNIVDDAQVEYVPGGGHHFIITGSSSQVSGTSQSVTLTLYDVNNNQASNYSGNKSLIFSGASASPSGSTPTATNSSNVAINFGSTTVVSFVNGVATRSMVLYKAETALIAATDGTVNTTGSNRLSVTVSAGSVSAGQSTLEVGATGLNTGGTTAITVTLKDAYGNVVTGGSSSDFTLATDIGSIGTVNCSSGVCTATYTAPGSNGTANITAKIGGTNMVGSPATVVIASVPGAPTGLNATRGNTQVSLTWTAPASNGGSAITDYIVEYSSDGGTNWTVFNDGVSTTAAATVTGLTNGTEYTFRVTAKNAVGNSSASSTATATPATVPGAPTSLATTPSSGQVALTWSAPASNGGSAITDYIVEYSTDGTNWTTFNDGTSTTASTTVTGLSNGTAYTFRVSAVNAVGTGAASSTATATPAVAPDAPTSLNATAGNTQVSLTWSAPGSNGGSAITDYIVEYSTDGTNFTVFNDGTSTNTNATVTGLTNGTLYTFRVKAVNPVGTGSASSTATATPAGVPDAPTNLTLKPSATSMALSWTAPASNGGSAITDYVVEYKTSASSTWLTFSDGVSTTTSATVTGLTSGTSYDFRMSAKNVIGTGSATSASTATPGAPHAPTSLGVTLNQATATAHFAYLSWTAPSNNGGSAITDYVVEYKTAAASSWTTFNPTVRTATADSISGLSNNTTYNFRVYAKNSVGNGSTSSTVSATTTGPSERLACTSPGSSNSNTTDVAITPCSGVAAGNIIIIPVTISNTSTTTAKTISQSTGTTGFTALTSQLSGAHQTTIFYKIADASDAIRTADYGFQWSGSEKAAITLVAYKNVANTAPGFTAGSGTSATMSSPSITVSSPTTVHTLVYIYTAQQRLSSTTPTLSEWTLSSDLFKNTTAGSNNNQATLVLTADVDKTAAGTTASGKTATQEYMDSSTKWTVTVLSIHP